MNRVCPLDMETVTLLSFLGICYVCKCVKNRVNISVCLCVWMNVFAYYLLNGVLSRTICRVKSAFITIHSNG